VELVALHGLDEDVGEDGHGALLLDDALRAGERPRQLLNADLQFYGRASLLFFFVVVVGNGEM